jgi:hypothetical protein
MIQSKQHIGNGSNLLQLKIVYWGPGESGKTTNFYRLKEKFYEERITEGYSIQTTSGRTLWHDSLFLSFNFSLNGMLYYVVCQVITCTGQERFLSTREYVLNTADGAVFIGDSDPTKLEENKRSFRELMSFARKRHIPYIIQLNKQDLQNAITIEEFKEALELPLQDKFPDGTRVVYPACAITGRNIVECFQDLTVSILTSHFSLLL